MRCVTRRRCPAGFLPPPHGKALHGPARHPGSPGFQYSCPVLKNPQCLIFHFSIQKKSLRGDKADTIYSEFEAELSEMAETLSEIGATIRDSAELDPNTSYSRKFAVILQQYIEELSTSIIRVLQICRQRHRSKLGEEAYDSEQSREDLTKYDESIQNHKRLGIKLNRMAPRL